MIDEGRGVPRVLAITKGSGAGGDTILDVRPAAGEMWDFYFLRASTDDAARDGSWLARDEDTPLTATLYSWVGATSRYLYADLPSLRSPLRLTYSSYVQVKFLAMAGAKTITANIMVERILGAPFLFTGT